MRYEPFDSIMRDARMSRFERRAWLVAFVIIGIWCVAFGLWLMLAPMPAILYP
jgi:hypothetical protein